MSLSTTSLYSFPALLLSSCSASSPSAAPPAIAVHPLPTTVVRGDPVTLDCRVDDDADDAVVEWYRDGRPVDIDPSVSTDR